MRMADGKQGLLRKQGLGTEELQEIEQLAAQCEQYEQLEMKLNWNVLRERPAGETNDFLYYEQGQLVGYLALFCFNSQEAEISGMVHPAYRQRGIFRTLFQAATQEVRRRGVPQILCIVEHKSQAGQAYIQTLDTRFHHAEYKMVLQEPRLPGKSIEGLTFRQAQPEDGMLLAHITAVAFDMPRSEVTWYSQGNGNVNLRRPSYLAQLRDVYIGKLDVSLGEQEAYIIGFGVLPEFQHRGYGRQLLAYAIQETLKRNPGRIVLEVMTENQGALSLYQSCGFQVVTSYDYYSYPVSR
ncbi:GNAT family N-acetyltransferase [Ktedonobacter sp. SOSP1-52]|nr:GNAT family N-acetyltransferase [Ktedonobacter sp. SOSP1-52]